MLRKKIFFLTPFNDVDLHMSMEFVTFDVGELEASGSTEVVQERIQKMRTTLTSSTHLKVNNEYYIKIFIKVRWVCTIRTCEGTEVPPHLP
jgi:hypothetical protein